MSFSQEEIEAMNRYFGVGAPYADQDDLITLRRAVFREIGIEDARARDGDDSHAVEGEERYNQDVLWRIVTGVEAELNKRRLEAIKDLPPEERLAALDGIEQERIDSLRGVMLETMRNIPT